MLGCQEGHSANYIILKKDRKNDLPNFRLPDDFRLQISAGETNRIVSVHRNAAAV